MKRKTMLFAGLIISLMVSCEDDNAFDNTEFKVIVESTHDIACGLPLLRFLDKPEQVEDKTSLKTLTYTAYDLDPSLNIAGKELIIRFTKTSKKDLRICNTLGIHYPSVAIIDAKLAD